MPCPDSDTVKVKDILIVHPNCNSDASRWAITCETGTVAALCERCYCGRIADLTPAILVGHTCVVGPLYTPAVLDRVRAEREKLGSMRVKVSQSHEALSLLRAHADSVCDALENPLPALERLGWIKQSRRLGRAYRLRQEKVSKQEAILTNLGAAIEVCGVRRAVDSQPHPLFTHIHRSIDSKNAVEEDLATLLRDTIRNQNHRMAGLLAAKLLLLHHDPRDQPGKHLEEQGHLILDMINAAREETP